MKKKSTQKTKTFSKLKKITLKQLILPLGILITLAGISITIFAINKSHRELEIYTEITFVSPTEALIFWKSEKDTLGYVRSGEKKFGKKEITTQTSSTPGTVHVVFLENIPLEGIYIQKINENDNFLIIPNTEHIKYDSNKNLDE